MYKRMILQQSSMSLRLIGIVESAMVTKCFCRAKSGSTNLFVKRHDFSQYNKLLNVPNLLNSDKKYMWGGITKKPNELIFKTMDGIPEDFNLIYRTTADKYIKWGYLLSCTMSALVAAGILFKYEHELFVTSDKFMPLSNELTILIGSFTLLFILIQLYVGQVPLRIYNMELQKKYIFVFNGRIPLTLKKIKCRRGDVTKVDSSMILSDILPWHNCGYLIKDSKKVLLFEESFRKPADLHILLGRQDND